MSPLRSTLVLFDGSLNHNQPNTIVKLTYSNHCLYIQHNACRNDGIKETKSSVQEAINVCPLFMERKDLHDKTARYNSEGFSATVSYQSRESEHWTRLSDY
jgi:hypothetical protein